MVFSGPGCTPHLWWFNRRGTLGDETSMSLPQAAEYGEAIQDLPANFCDPEIRAGRTSTGLLGQPLIWNGNFAAVFQVCGTAPGQKWALKCFTRQVKGLQERYRRIDAHLRQQPLPFMVGFRYLPDEVLVRGQRFPVLKMDWVEGLQLDEFLADCFEKGNAKGTLRMLCEMWVKLAQRMRAADVTHGDLQHGNVILVPVPDKEAYNLRLIDYDGLHVPALAGMPPGEVGHAAYQHPERLATGAYGPETDRFSHLLIYTTLRCLIAGGRELWDRHYNEDRLLVGHPDLVAPEDSAVFRELWQLADPAARMLVGHLAMAARSPLGDVPLLGEVVQDGRVVALGKAQQAQVARWLSPPTAVSVVEALIASAPPVVVEVGSAAESVVEATLVEPARPATGRTTASTTESDMEWARPRTWTSADGKFAIKARFVGRIGGLVFLEKQDGRTITVPRERLIPSDWVWVQNHGWPFDNRVDSRSTGGWLPALLSLFIPGLGQMLLGRFGRAMGHFVVAVCLWMVLLGWIVHLYSAHEASR